MSALNTVLEKRRVCRIRFTKQAKIVEDMLADVDPANEATFQLHATRARSTFDILSLLNDDLKAVQDDVDFHPDYDDWFHQKTPDEQQNEETRESTYIVRYANIQASMEIHQDKLTKIQDDHDTTIDSQNVQQQIFTPQDFADGISQALAASFGNKKRHINIPKFSGNTEFFETWQSMVIAELEKPGYSDAEKSYFVFSLLDGEAKKLCLCLKDPSHMELLQFLELKYGDVKVKIEKAMIDISNLPIIGNSVKELENAYTTLLGAWNYLLKKHHDEHSLKNESWMLSALVRSKFPREIVKEWDADVQKAERQAGIDTQIFPENFEKLLERIYDSFELAKKLEHHQIIVSNSNESKPTPSKIEEKANIQKEYRRPSGHALSAGEQTNQHTQQCIFCSKNHQSKNCTASFSKDQRWEKAWTNKVCFNCLNKDHLSRHCDLQGQCKHCKGYHHTLLHIEQDKKKTGGSFSSMSQSKGTTVILQTAVVKVVACKNQSVSTARVLFDNGSTTTFCSEKLAKKLGIFSGKKHSCKFKLVGGSTITRQCREVQLLLSSAFPSWKGESFRVSAYTIDTPAANIQPIDYEVSGVDHLRNLMLAEKFPHGELGIDILLSIEDSMKILMDARVKGSDGLPCAQMSHIGWVPYGTVPEETHLNRTDSSCGLVQLAYSVSILSQDPVEKFWELDSLGIKPNEENTNSMKPLEKEALEQHERETKQLENGHYETTLLTHPDFIDKIIPDNYEIAKKRLLSFENQVLDRNQMSVVNGLIEELLEYDRAEIVVELDHNYDNVQKKPHQEWFLPLQLVIREGSITTKCRLVYDGSSKNKYGISLNDTLLAGPSLHPDILAILLRFRRHRIALIADIEKMFLQIKIKHKDRDRQRFLWRWLDQSRKPIIFRLTGVTFGLKPSPFSSMKIVQDHAKSLEIEYPEASHEIVQNMFVDDILTGGESVEKTSELAKDLKSLMSRGGFPLRKFISNKPEALSGLCEEDLATYHVKTSNEDTFATKTLGVQYHPKEDVLMFSFIDKMEVLDIETRRTMMQQLCRIFDVMGALSPFIIRGKQLLQLSWMSGLEFDDPLPSDIQEAWKSWKNGVALLDEIKLNRCIIPAHFSNPIVSLHGFADACLQSYGACIYARVEDEATGDVVINLLTAKTRVAPLKNQRILHELELMAALILARLVHYVLVELKMDIESVHCWTDSLVTLYWIRKPAYNWQTFVSNRTAEIQRLLDPQCFKHVPGSENPADICSRGCSAESLISSEIWWNGAPFLKYPPSEWPKQIDIPEPVAQKAESKRKKTVIPIHHVTKGKAVAGLDLIKKYNSLGKFLGVMSRIRSWLTRFRSRKSGNPLNNTNVQNYQAELVYWLKWAQRDLIIEFSTKQPLPKDSKLALLDPYIDNNGLLRVGGRCDYAPFSDQTKHPIILPTHNELVDMLVLHYHVSHGHTGTVHTLSSLRYKYWIIHGRQEVRRIIHKCIVCETRLPMAQKMAPLPLDRVSPSEAFTVVGTDFAGPIYIKVLTSEVKVHIVLFVDTVCRGCHLEIVEAPSAEAFLKSLERMMGRRGRVVVMYSDNAQAFKKSNKVLTALFKQGSKERKKIEDGLRERGIEWKYITERAPWHGGFYERFVQTVKKPLRKILGNAKLTYTELETVICDIEAQINSRPLTDVSASPQDPLPLTPAHLLVGRNLQLLPDVKPEMDKTPLTKRWRYRQTLSRNWWKRWEKEYFPVLIPFRKWIDEHPNAVIGQLVHVRDESLKKMDWKLAKIVEVHKGRDDLVRSCTVKLAKTGKLLRRPVQKLAPLEGDM